MLLVAVVGSALALGIAKRAGERQNIREPKTGQPSRVHMDASSQQRKTAMAKNLGSMLDSQLYRGLDSHSVLVNQPEYSFIGGKTDAERMNNVYRTATSRSLQINWDRIEGMKNGIPTVSYHREGTNIATPLTPLPGIENAPGYFLSTISPTTKKYWERFRKANDLDTKFNQEPEYRYSRYPHYRGKMDSTLRSTSRG